LVPVAADAGAHCPVGGVQTLAETGTGVVEHLPPEAGFAENLEDRRHLVAQPEARRGAPVILVGIAGGARVGAHRIAIKPARHAALGAELELAEAALDAKLQRAGAFARGL